MSNGHRVPGSHTLRFRLKGDPKCNLPSGNLTFQLSARSGESPFVEAAYIEIRDSKVANTVPLDDGNEAVDFDSAGQVTGFEFLVHSRLPKDFKAYLAYDFRQDTLLAHAALATAMKFWESIEKSLAVYREENLPRDTTVSLVSRILPSSPGGSAWHHPSHSERMRRIGA